MLRKMKEKAGNEILQTLVIIAVIGALAITVAVLISSKLRNTASTSTQEVGNGLSNSIAEFSYTSAESQALINKAAGKTQ